MSTKRDEANALFSQGLLPDSAEVEALGLKTATAKRYYRDWKGAQSDPEPEPAAPTAPEPGSIACVGGLQPGQSFTHEGDDYTVSAVYPFGVMAVLAEPSPDRRPVERLQLDTLVDVK